jgi:hypothetical protein
MIEFGARGVLLNIAWQQFDGSVLTSRKVASGRFTLELCMTKPGVWLRAKGKTSWGATKLLMWQRAVLCSWYWKFASWSIETYMWPRWLHCVDHLCKHSWLARVKHSKTSWGLTVPVWMKCKKAWNSPQVLCGCDWASWRRMSTKQFSRHESFSCEHQKLCALPPLGWMK